MNALLNLLSDKVLHFSFLSFSIATINYTPITIENIADIIFYATQKKSY